MAATMEEIKDYFDPKFNSLEGKLNSLVGTLNSLEGTLNLLASVNPDAVLRTIDPPLVGQGTSTERDAVRDGAVSTWTYMRDGDRKMAVGAAHCVLSRKINTDKLNQAMMVHLANTEFVEIPPELKDHVTHVGFCGNYMSVKSDAKDVAILILDQFPDGVDAAKAILWKDFDSSPAPRVHAKVGGLSLSGSVRGHECYVGRTIRFGEDSGEGGQCGTLMFNISPPDGVQPYVLGVYYGCRRLGIADMKRRGAIVKLPPLARTKVYAKVNIKIPAGYILPLRKLNRKKSSRSFKSVDGFEFKRGDEAIHGAFVSLSGCSWDVFKKRDIPV